MFLKMRLREINEIPLRALARISPSTYSSLQQCPLRGIWIANSLPSLLPCSPAAYLGTAVHRLIDSCFQGDIRDEAALTACWNYQISQLETEMLANPIEKHLVPLQQNAFNYEFKKILAFNLARHFFNNLTISQGGRQKQESETWLQTPNGKVGGRIDLIKRTPEGVEIVDYKTGSLTNDPLDLVPKEEYQQQIKLYAALYHAVHGAWPIRMKLIGLDNSVYSIEVNSLECERLLESGERFLDEINNLISRGTNSKDFAKPSIEACKYCQYRPACEKYWECRQDNGKWPIDLKGIVKEKKQLLNGYYRIVVETGTRNVAIRGLSTHRNPFLEAEIKEVLFCDLANDSVDGCYYQKTLTTGYVLQ